MLSDKSNENNYIASLMFVFVFSSPPPDLAHPPFLLFASLLLQTIIIPVIHLFIPHENTQVQSCMYS